MRILQIIDTLEGGGAERMAVNYANALAEQIEFSGIVATRFEGILKNQLNSEVGYLFLNRKQIIDFSAFLKLRAYCKKNQITILHAHGTSFFSAFCLKLLYWKIKIVWHDHYGLSEFLSNRSSWALKLLSPFFAGIISVNEQLKNWAIKELYCSKVCYLPNFTHFNSENASGKPLMGTSGKRILCLANLRDQKNHLMLLDIAERLRKSHPDWSFHLVGKDFNDDYSAVIKNQILERNLTDSVYFYGTRNDVKFVIDQSEIAILTSKSEGLPVALLEYGLNKKPVVVTQVGEIPLIVKNKQNGLLIASGQSEEFYQALVYLIENQNDRIRLGESLFETIMQHHSQEAVIKEYINWVNQI
ncbi:MAG: glycosyltransferase [Bacteroidetes bacterium]|nr:glycosyltransferase [Bacteroidota bacterium]